MTATDFKFMPGRWLSFEDHFTGVNPSGTVLHAIEWREVAHQGKHKMRTALCGRRVYVAGQECVDTEGKPIGGAPMPWPPRNRGERGEHRCRDCWVATGKPRPHARWSIADEAKVGDR